MERIKIHLPETFIFSTKLVIRITDLNYGGHVGNDAFLSLIHEARQQFLKSHNYSELNFEGVGLIMADAAIEFKKELSYADEITISVAANGFEKYGFDLYYKLELQTETKEVLAGKAKTGMLCFDYVNKKLVAIPKNALDNLMQASRNDKS
jgi:YbgC/YbaW family acyl-CoA thioester hydrolase